LGSATAHLPFNMADIQAQTQVDDGAVILPAGAMNGWSSRTSRFEDISSLWGPPQPTPTRSPVDNDGIWGPPSPTDPVLSEEELRPQLPIGPSRAESGTASLWNGASANPARSIWPQWTGEVPVPAAEAPLDLLGAAVGRDVGGSPAQLHQGGRCDGSCADVAAEVVVAPLCPPDCPQSQGAVVDMQACARGATDPGRRRETPSSHDDYPDYQQENMPISLWKRVCMPDQSSVGSVVARRWARLLGKLFANLMGAVPLENGVPTSIGSLAHASGAKCRPCLFLAKGKGCFDGVFCKFCHFSGNHILDPAHKPSRRSKTRRRRRNGRGHNDGSGDER